MAGRMEDLLMGGDSSGSDSDDDQSKGAGATQITASTAGTGAGGPPIVSTAKPSSGSELTNRLKNLYKSPPATAPPKVGTPTAAGGAGQVPRQQQQQQRGNVPIVNKPTTTTSAIPSSRRGGASGGASAMPGARAIPPPVAASTSSRPGHPSGGGSSNPAANNPNYIPPMVHTNHHGQPTQQQQQQPQQQRYQPQRQHSGGVPPPQPVQIATVGRVPAPLPAARTSNRAAPPGNRVASVPPVQSRSSAPMVNMNTPAGAPPPSPLTANQHPQSSSRQQYAHAPHLQRGPGNVVPASSSQRSSSQSSQQVQQQQRVSSSSSSRQPQQMHQSSSSRSNSGMVSQPSQGSGTPRSTGSGSSSLSMTEKEKKEKERFLMFTRVLMKYLEQRDGDMHKKAKAEIKECYERNKSGDPQFQSLTVSMKARLRETVGEGYWKKAHDYLEHFLKQKKDQRSRHPQQQIFHPQQQAQQQQLPPSSQHRGGVPPPTVQVSAPRPSTQQQHLMTQSQAAAAAAQKVPIPSVSRSAPAISSTQQQQQPPSTIPVAVPPITKTAKQPLTAEEKKKQEAAKKKARNEREKKRRAEKRKKDKEAAAEAAKAKKASAGAAHPGGVVTNLPTGRGITHSTTPVMTPPNISTTIPTSAASTASSNTSVTSTSTGKAKDKKADAAAKAKKKKKTLTKQTSSSSSITKKKIVPREPTQRLMESIDHATLIDVKSLPNIFTTKEYKMDIDLNEEQRILLYGDEKRQQQVKDIARAASAALDNAMSAEALETEFKEAGVPPLPMCIPTAYEGWGNKNVVSVRTAWARVRLPESEMLIAEKEKEKTDRMNIEQPMFAQTKPDIMAERVVSSSSPSPPAIVSATSSDNDATPTLEDDTTNHVWFNESRAEQDPTLALLSEATEQFLKSTIEAAIGKARLRLNLDGVRLWHTLQAHSLLPENSSRPVPPAVIRLGCDVRRQVALSEGNAAKVYQRMEEAISRQSDTYHTNNDDDTEKMLLEATSMADLSKKAPLESAAQVADIDAKRKFAVFVGAGCTEPPLGRVPKTAINKVTLQDLEVGAVGNRMSMIGSRRKRFRVGLKY